MDDPEALGRAIVGEVAGRVLNVLVPAAVDAVADGRHHVDQWPRVVFRGASRQEDVDRLTVFGLPDLEDWEPESDGSYGETGDDGFEMHLEGWLRAPLAAVLPRSG